LCRRDSGDRSAGQPLCELQRPVRAAERDGARFPAARLSQGAESGGRRQGQLPGRQTVRLARGVLIEAIEHPRGRRFRAALWHALSRHHGKEPGDRIGIRRQVGGHAHSAGRRSASVFREERCGRPCADLYPQDHRKSLLASEGDAPPDAWHRHSSAGRHPSRQCGRHDPARIIRHGPTAWPLRFQRTAGPDRERGQCHQSQARPEPLSGSGL
ncbi:hypothetical protein OY671_009380, partial [Metschnikowia pulcherrima]